MEFEWNKDKAKANLSKHGVSFDEAKTVVEDELRPEYNLRSLRIRKVGPERTGFGEQGGGRGSN